MLSNKIIKKLNIIKLSLFFIIIILLYTIEVCNAIEPEWVNRASNNVYSLDISPDGSYIVVGSRDYKVYLIDREGVLLWSYKTQSYVESVAISLDMRHIAVGSDKIYFFSKNGSLMWSYETGHIRSLAVSSNHIVVGTVAPYGNILLFNKEGKLIWRFILIGDCIESVAISSDERYIVAGDWDNKVYFFDKGDDPLWSYETGGIVWSVDISPDNRYVIASSDKIYLFDFYGNLLWSYNCSGLAKFSYDGKYIILTSKDNVYLLDTEGNLLWSYKATSNIVSVAISNNNHYIVIGTDYPDNQVYFLDIDGNLIWSYKCLAEVSSVAISSDGLYIVVGDVDGRLYFFDNRKVLLTTGFLQITSTPSNANVYINGEYIGTTPKTVELKEGTYEVKITKFGYYNYTETIYIQAGETYTLNISLKPVPTGYVEVISSPPKAKIYVDGEYRGLTPVTIKLKEGNHKLRIIKLGYYEHIEIIQISAGETKSLNITLKPIPTPTPIKKPPIAKIKGKTVVYEGVEVVLSALDSYDPDGKIVSYQWIDEYGVVVSTEPILRKVFTIGEHTITLEVVDDDGLTSRDTVTITVLQKSSRNPEITVGLKSVNFEDGLLQISVANTGNGDAYDVIVSVYIPSGMTVHYIDGVHEAGSILTVKIDVLRSGDQHTIDLGFQLLKDSVIVPVKVKYRDLEGSEKSISDELYISIPTSATTTVKIVEEKNNEDNKQLVWIILIVIIFAGIAVMLALMKIRIIIK